MTVGPSRIVLVPGTLALLPAYAGLIDPVADLRSACLRAVTSLGRDVQVVAHGSGARVAQHLLAATDGRRVGADASCLVVGNGSATRSEKAPGHLDERAHPFDDALRVALTAPDPAALGAVDSDLAAELWADTASFAHLGSLLGPEQAATVFYDADPFGVQYWVISWADRCSTSAPPSARNTGRS